MSTILDSAQVLVTGGSDGIGLALAARFLAAGGAVTVTGRDPAKLARAAAAHPGLQTLTSDASDPAAREALAAHLGQSMPGLNVVIHSAGVQRWVSLAADGAPWAERQRELDTLLSGPIHLNHLLVPQLLAHGAPSLLVNVTSGGAFVPQVFAPVYSAAKAALHSYTVTLRHALAATRVRVVELAPPAVQTALLGEGTHGAPLDAFADEVFAALTGTDAALVGYGPTATPAFQQLAHAADGAFAASAQRFPVRRYPSMNPSS